jgi:hypothetical protein
MSNWLEAAEALAAVLAEENAALEALDLPRAAGMLARKMECAEAFQAARDALATQGGPAHEVAVAMMERLATLAAENRRLLDRGIKAQGQVIGLVAGAVRKSAMQPRYGARGALRTERAPLTVTLRAQA